jgi:hypothetical protein
MMKSPVPAVERGVGFASHRVAAKLDVLVAWCSLGVRCTRPRPARDATGVAAASA